MKKTFTSLFLFCLFSLPLFSVNGYLRYSIKYSGPDANNPKVLLNYTQIEFFFSDEAISVRCSGGFLASLLGTSVWYKSKPDSIYQVSHANRTVYVRSYPPSAIRNFTAKKTGKKLNIAGYEGQEYKVTYSEKDSTITQRVWATSSFPYGTLPSLFAGHQLIRMFQQGSPGFPLKMEYEENAHQMQLTVTVTLETENKNKQEKDIFELPKDYVHVVTQPGTPISFGSKEK